MKESSWKALVREFGKAEENREKVVLLSRELIQQSKRVIYATHRSEFKAAEKDLAAMRPHLTKLKALQKAASPDAINSMRVAEQEFVEAACLLEVLQGRDVPSHAALKVSTESYLLGLCDLVGELGRAGVHRIIGNDYHSAVRLQKIVHDLYGRFMHLNLRNGELRKKVDGVKWELKKMEDVILQLKVSGRI